MHSLEDVTNFCRLYFVDYSLEHDISLEGNTSYWSCQLSLQPSVAGQMALFRKVFRGDDYVADEIKGQMLVRFPIQTIGHILRVDQIVAKIIPYCKGLAGATVQLQVLIAPKDDEYQEAFSRAQKWEWLISSTCLGELFLSGEITDDGISFSKIFHSCHQADLNRDITDDIVHINNSWTMLFHEVLADAKSEMDINKHLDIKVHDKADKPYSISFDDPAELQKVVNMCNSLELGDKYNITANKNVLDVDMNCVTFTDLLFAVNTSQMYNLFGSDAH
ncbi:MAG: hypothetical protein Q4F00_12560 [bacterium]|nr:hypothetical protein [bacterium]